MNYNLAKQELLSGTTKNCTDFFKENNYLLEYGYSLILQGRLKEAESVMRSLDSLRAKWALSLTQFMQGYVEHFPTSFQIRNFLEIDINLLILAKQQDSINYILGGADILYSINCESYKYLARVFMNNGYFNVAKTYLDKAEAKTENDPELYYMITMYHITLKEYRDALHALNRCLEFLPEYYPALRLKNTLTSFIS